MKVQKLWLNYQAEFVVCALSECHRASKDEFYRATYGGPCGTLEGLISMYLMGGEL
jgi:hypothetical protein